MGSSKKKLSALLEGKKVLVEAGHIYTNQTLRDFDAQGVYLGAAVSETLSHFGAHVIPVLFVDDYTPQFEDVTSNTLNLNHYMTLLETHGFSAQDVIYESSLVSAAHLALGDLQEKGLLIETPEGIYLDHKKKPKLFDFEQQKYSCALLDSCLYQKKDALADASVTILPKSYHSQQKNTKRILASLDFQHTAHKVLLYEQKKHQQDILDPLLHLAQVVASFYEKVEVKK